MEETKTNRYGFPIVTCSRCHGTGHFSFNTVDGTTCLKCGGNGRTIAKKAIPAWTAFKAAAKKMSEKIWGEVEVGDVVKTNDGIAEVIAIELGDNDTVTATLRINDEVTVVSKSKFLYTKLKQTKPINVTPFLKMIPK